MVKKEYFVEHFSCGNSDKSWHWFTLTYPFGIPLVTVKVKLIISELTAHLHTYFYHAIKKAVKIHSFDFGCAVLNYISLNNQSLQVWCAKNKQADLDNSWRPHQAPAGQEQKYEDKNINSWSLCECRCTLGAINIDCFDSSNSYII